MFAKKKPLTLYRHPGLYLEQVRNKGRGVFCLEDLKKDDRLEVAPVMIFPTNQTTTACQTLLVDYIFSVAGFPEKYLKSICIENAEDSACLPLGITSICNHMIEPNASYSFTTDDLNPYAILSATRDIPKGEEITVSYGATWFIKHKLHAKK